MREKFPLLALGLCATAVILYWLISAPIQAEISQMQAETRRLQAISAELSKLQARYENFAEVVSKAEENLSLAQEYLPDELDDEKFIATLYQIAENKKILITSVTVGDIQSGEVQSQIIRVRLEATYFALLNFIGEILDGGRLARLENFSVSGGDSDFLDCELEFTIFATNHAPK